MTQSLIRRPELLPVPIALAAWGTMLWDLQQSENWRCCQATEGSWGETQGWVLMVAAMMLPTLIPMLGSVARRSYRARRLRTVAASILGYTAVWLLPLPLLLLLKQATETVVAPWLAVLFCLIAAGWAYLPGRRRWFAQHHREYRLCPLGLRADRDALVHGARSGLPCVAGCWPLMIACAFTGHDLVMMVAGTGFALYERRMFRFAPRPLASMAAAMGLWAVLIA